MVKNKVLIALAIVMFFIRSLQGIVPWTGLTHSPETKTKYFMHTGYIFDAVLRTAIFSYNLESPVIAETEYDIIYLDRVMIPKDSKIIGYASVLKSGNRVNVFFHTIVFPDGSEIKFGGLGLHTDGSAGIPGKVKKYRERVPAKILLETVSNVAAPGVGGAIVRGLAGEVQKEMETYQPTYSISVKKDIPILIYNIERIEY
ncbi:MAG: TrbI/VirB10 family protein [Elusimicrobiota bacterium]|nr:TrbI/VirB10 family protein [Elusimicrobiota bacterium]